MNSLECKQVNKVFSDGKNKLHVLKNVDLSIKQGSQVAIMGRSGSGKSTLLQLLGGLDFPTQGRVFINGKDFTQLTERKREQVRNKSLGFIYQFHHLLPEFSALENVAMPLLIAGVAPKQAEASAAKLLKVVDLLHRKEHRPGKLSGGERQRVAIARALVNNPDCILADEPTGNLDSENAEMAFNLMQSLNRERGTTFVVVTHDQELANRLDEQYHLREGTI